jgi:hypothetical protein
MSPLLMLGAARCICILVICLSYTFALGWLGFVTKPIFIPNWSGTVGAITAARRRRGMILAEADVSVNHVDDGSGVKKRTDMLIPPTIH